MVHRGCGTADESPQCALRNPPAAWVHVSPGQFRVRLDQLERTNTFGLHPPSVSFFLLRLLNTTSSTGVHTTISAMPFSNAHRANSLPGRYLVYIRLQGEKTSKALQCSASPEIELEFRQSGTHRGLGNAFSWQQHHRLRSSWRRSWPAAEQTKPTAAPQPLDSPRTLRTLACVFDCFAVVLIVFQLLGYSFLVLVLSLSVQADKIHNRQTRIDLSIELAQKKS